MEFEDVSMEEAFEDLRKDLESGKPLSGPSLSTHNNPPVKISLIV